MTPPELCTYIHAQDDVRKLHGITGPDAEGFYRYLIETPFLSFPRFVVGRISEDGEAVIVLMSCGRLENARMAFQQ